MEDKKEAEKKAREERARSLREEIKKITRPEKIKEEDTAGQPEEERASQENYRDFINRKAREKAVQEKEPGGDTSANEASR